VWLTPTAALRASAHQWSVAKMPVLSLTLRIAKWEAWEEDARVLQLLERNSHDLYFIFH